MKADFNARQQGAGTSSQADTRADRPALDRPPSPLTVGKFEAQPGFRRQRPPAGSRLNADGRFSYAWVGPLAATEHPDIAATPCRIAFCNQVADLVNGIDNGMPTTIVSLCAGGLLPDQMRHGLLSKANQETVRYVACDPKYNQAWSDKANFDTNRRARLKFKDGKAEAHAFSAFTAYAGKQVDGRGLLERHKQGNVIGIFEDPTSFLPGQMENLPQDLRDNGIVMRGKPVPEADVDKANAIYVTVGGNDPNGRAVVDGIARSLESGIGFGTSTLKCFPEPDDRISFRSGGHVPEKLSQFIRQEAGRHATPPVLGELPIVRLKRTLDQVKQQVDAAGMPFIVGIVPVNDLDRVRQEFMQRCVDARGVVYLASFENNRIAIENLKP